MTFGIINKDYACSLCGKQMRKQRKDPSMVHMCTPCNNALAGMDAKANRIFAE